MIKLFFSEKITFKNVIGCIKYSNIFKKFQVPMNNIFKLQQNKNRFSLFKYLIFLINIYKKN